MYISKEYQYRVGIRRPLIPFFRKFWVVGHKQELIAGISRITLRFPDGGLLSIPDVGRWWVKVYPEFESATEAQARLKPNQGLQDASIPDFGE